MNYPIAARFYRLLSSAAILFAALSSITATAATANDDKKSNGKSNFAKLDGARVRYINYGKGDEALVLIHGWTQNADSWSDNVAEFAKRSRVIIVELPGHGESDKPQTGYTMDYFARAVDAVMRNAKVKRAVLVGHSMGTPVARQFYRKYPEKTLGIVIVDGSLRPFFDKTTMDGLLAGLRGPKHRDTIDQMFGMMMGPGLTSEAKQRITSSAANTPQHVFTNAMAAMGDPAIWTEDKINVPVLAILAKSPLFPPNVEDLFRAIAPKMEFHLWEGV